MRNGTLFINRVRIESVSEASARRPVDGHQGLFYADSKDGWTTIVLENGTGKSAETTNHDYINNTLIPMVQRLMGSA